MIFIKDRQLNFACRGLFLLFPKVMWKALCSVSLSFIERSEMLGRAGGLLHSYNEDGYL